jgi:hypothetical protein
LALRYVYGLSAISVIDTHAFVIDMPGRLYKA